MSEAMTKEQLIHALESFSRYVALDCYDVRLPDGVEKSERLLWHLSNVRRAIDALRARPA